ncbi:MAG TPA: STAS domain-containing protein [Luteimonas sp.]|nr:STAS domain-containing protein [Luteimonas sp.]
MPTPTESGVRRDGDALVFSGALTRDAVPGLWPRVQAEAGIARLDLGAVEIVDSAGLAMLSELAARTQVGPMVVVGSPRGLVELCVAYRLDDALAFAA